MLMMQTNQAILTLDHHISSLSSRSSSKLSAVSKTMISLRLGSPLDVAARACEGRIVSPITPSAVLTPQVVAIALMVLLLLAGVHLAVAVHSVAGQLALVWTISCNMFF